MLGFAKDDDFAGLDRYGRPRLRARFCFAGVSLAASRKRDARTGHSAHLASLHQYSTQSNRAGYPLVWKAILRLDAIAGFMAFSESEQSENETGWMVPLCAARVQGLGPDDVAVFKCGACGHTAELWPSLLTHGLGLQPTDKVLALEQRLRCRLCYARNQAVVTIKYLDCQPGTDWRRHYGASRFCRAATVLGGNSGTCIMLSSPPANGR